MNVISYSIVPLLLLFGLTKAQVVPDRIEFAGMELVLTKNAKARIQADVDMIKKSPTYFQQKVDRANLYFPIIERVFTEENFPTAFKFLALQESSLVSDAVSSSQAVGYWQFKKESAVEVGVRVDHFVDERMNIFASSRGASKYLKRNQGVLNNWIYTLLSYNLGLGGVKMHVKEKYVGAQKMEIDEDMHWYVFRFLAHKIAYEGAVGNAYHSQLHIVGYKESERKSLSKIAQETGISEDLLLDYNKWCLKKELPGNGEYVVVLPVPVNDKDQYIAKYEKGNTSLVSPPVIYTSSTDPLKPSKIVYTAIDDLTDWNNTPVWVSINRVRAVRVSAKDNIDNISLAAGISKAGFLRFNEIESFDQLKEGQYYYLQLKRTKAIIAFHTVQKGESVWSIAQHYGVTTNAIRSKNRMNKNEALQEGRVLWLRDKRPKDQAIEYKSIVPEVITDIRSVFPKDTSIVTNQELPKQTTLVIDTMLYRYHLVNAGETMFGLSRQYGVSSDSILSWNNMSGYGLKLGQNLIVGKKEKEVRHVVQQGETLYKISKQYNVPIDMILKRNHKTESALKLGEELIIP